MKYLLPGKLMRDSVLKPSIAGCSRRPTTLQISRLSEEKQVFSINCIIHTNNLGTVSHFYQLGNSGNPPKIQTLRCQPRAGRASRPLPGQQSQACWIKPFLRTPSEPSAKFLLFPLLCQTETSSHTLP